MADFFISFDNRDRHWAEWVAWTLEEAGYTVVLPSRDFKIGQSFVVAMQRALRASDRIIAVVSNSYLDAEYTQPEWQSAFVSDPRGRDRKLIPVRVDPVQPSGLLASLIYIDLVGKDESEAKTALLGALGERKKPTQAPEFPHRAHRAVKAVPLAYPGAAIDDPPELYPYLEQFRCKYPDQHKCAFIMMRFGASPRHDKILQAIRAALGRHGILALRADDMAFVDYLMPNIRTYMHGCGFGIAVFERIESDSHNPNVALEVGYMLALGKRVCLLKDQTMTRLPTDIVGSLYMEFDMDDIEASVPESVDRWLKQRGLIAA